MRKFISATGCIAALLLSTSLTACSGSATDENGEETSSVSIEEIDKNFSIGKTEGQTYTNDFFNLSFTVPDDWSLLNEEQLAQLGSNVKDVLTEDSAKEALDNGKTTFIMQGVAKDATQNASIFTEKHDIERNDNIDMDAFFENTIHSLESALPAQGFDNLLVEKSTVTYLGEEKDAIKITADYNPSDQSVEGSESNESSETDSSASEETKGNSAGRPIYEAQVYDFTGSYSCCVTVSSFDSDKTQDILNMFSVLKSESDDTENDLQNEQN